MPVGGCACRWAEAQQAGGSWVSCAACAAYGDTVLSQRSNRFIVRTCPLMSVSVRTTAQFHVAARNAPAAHRLYRSAPAGLSSVLVRCCPYPSVQLHSSTWHPRKAPAAHRTVYVFLYIFYDEKYIVKISNHVILYITQNLQPTPEVISWKSLSVKLPTPQKNSPPG